MVVEVGEGWRPSSSLTSRWSSLWTRDPEPEVMPTCAQVGIGFVPFSPLGKGFLTGTVDPATSFQEGDIRATIPRFDAEHLPANQALWAWPETGTARRT
ncbi:aldo/keto reductase [Nonomuraea glycinis]|uniref:aldo/keto reductase n=1 Tax=Nonomuraea glycinis TaxID=2047744 RepID=UPI0033AF4D78